MRRRTFYSLIAFSTLAIAGCESASDPIVAGSASASTGDMQSAVAGSALPVQLGVLVNDTRGRPMKNVTVTFAVTAGGGLIATPSAVTGTDGVAHAGAWTLGNTAGVNTLTAQAAGVSTPVVFSATGVAGTPASITVQSGNAQSATVATKIAVTPTVVVKDTHDNAVAQSVVTFAVTSGGGAVASTSATTDASGVARAPDWTLGTTAGTNTMSASVAGVAPTIIVAKGTAGAPFAVAPRNTLPPTRVATTVATAPSVIVRDVYDNAVAGVNVTFTPTTGSGTVTGGAQVTDSLGVATAGSWTLGTGMGVQTLSASVNGIAPLAVNISALASTAAQMNVSTGENQSAAVSTAVATTPTVKVQDAYGNPVSGVTVNFAVASGGGSITGANPFTNSSGTASVASWVLGSTAGANTLTATASGLAAVTFHATATSTPVTPPVTSDPTKYNISVRYIVPPTARQQLAVDRAVARWQQVITGDLADVSANFGANQCGANPAVNENVDDLLLFVDFSNIDGVGKILGQAGPCFIRQSNGLTVVGELQLDAADLATMEANGTIDDVVLHEIGHILGIGSLWSYKGLQQFTATDSSTFTGPLAAAAFLAQGGVTFPGKPVPAENCVGISGCGNGTRDVHWREFVMGRELMTGYISPAGQTNPLSRITIQSLADLGYTVNLNAADSYTVGLSLRAGESPPDIPLIEGTPPVIRVMR